MRNLDPLPGVRRCHIQPAGMTLLNLFNRVWGSASRCRTTAFRTGLPTEDLPQTVSSQAATGVSTWKPSHRVKAGGHAGPVPDRGACLDGCGSPLDWIMIGLDLLIVRPCRTLFETHPAFSPYPAALLAPSRFRGFGFCPTSCLVPMRSALEVMAATRAGGYPGRSGPGRHPARRVGRGQTRAPDGGGLRAGLCVRDGHPRRQPLCGDGGSGSRSECLPARRLGDEVGPFSLRLRSTRKRRSDGHTSVLSAVSNDDMNPLLLSNRRRKTWTSSVESTAG
jgi:hypothetical protein